MNLRVPLLPRWLRWLAVLLVAAFIFYVSIVTAPPETVVDVVKPELIPLDKWRHSVAYATLGYALAYATSDWGLRVRSLALLVVVATVVYGIGIEVGQSALPARYFSVGDAYANAIGGFLVLPWYAVRSSLEFVPMGAWIRSLRP